MRKHDWDPMNESDFDKLLETNISGSPPDNFVAKVTPWEKSMERILIGLALTTIVLNFLYLNYILPAIGMVLSILGFRMLRTENKWFLICYIATIIRAVSMFSTLIMNTTIYQTSAPQLAISKTNIVLLFVLIFCLGKGLRTVQEKVGLPPQAGGVTALIIWYALLCLLAIVSYNGLIIMGAMIITYIFIIRSLYQLSKELDKYGCVIQTAPIKIADQTIVIGIAAVLLIGCVFGYVFGNSYNMDWRQKGATEHTDVEDIKKQLINLNFPPNILEDLSAEDIETCQGALQVIKDVHVYSFNQGRLKKEYSESDLLIGDAVGLRDRNYGIKNFQITNIAVHLPGEPQQWKIIHHFHWTTNPGFYGTESIQLWPAYQHSEDWRSVVDSISGRVLYDMNGESYVAPYHFLGNQTYTLKNIFGEQISTDIFAAFSLPNEGENQRGYISYSVLSITDEDRRLIDAWINYTHQKSWLQYPAMTAMEKRINSGGDEGAFQTIQGALQF